MLPSLSYRRFFVQWSVRAVLILLLGLPNVSYAQQVRVPAVFHRQEHSLSCEIATLKMALGVHSINIPERELISKLSFDTTPKSKGIWGDPNRGFVGNIDGRMLVDGYGVYWDPIAAVGNTYASASVMKHGSPQAVARAIADGNSVIIWGYYGQRGVYDWNTPDGKQIHAVGGEHTRLVYGFDGPVTAPVRFYLLDPSSGSFSWSTAELMHNWSSLSHMGVVVSPRTQWVRVPGDTKIWEIDMKNNTRRWVTTWKRFVERGGSPKAVTPINQAALLKYTIGAPII